MNQESLNFNFRDKFNKHKFIVLSILVDIFLILILWNIPILKYLIYPFKLLTVALHEFSHAIVGCFTGAKIVFIKIDPEEGGVTKMSGGMMCLVLPAGSSFIGGIMIFSGFSEIASMVVSIIVGVSLIVILYWARNWLLRTITVLFIILLGTAVYVAYSYESYRIYTRYFIVFMGLWDISEDLITRKVKESDATKFAKLTRVCPSRICGLFWFLISLLFIVISILLGMLVF